MKDLAPVATLVLPSIGFTIDAPDTATIDNPNPKSVFISWTGVKMHMRLKGDALFEVDLDAAVRTASAYGTVTRQGATSDGWEVRYDEEVAGDTLHNVIVTRTIGGTEVQFRGGSNTAPAEAQLVAACASLRKS